MVELFKHKERIAAATELPEDDLLDCLNALLARITFVEEGAIPIGTWHYTDPGKPVLVADID